MKFFITKDSTSIGRSSQNDICLPDPSISRTHLVITRDKDQYIATDKSTNGTFVNNSKISSIELKLNDIIRVGQWTIHFGETQKEHEMKTQVCELVPTRILSYRPGQNELVSERGMLEILGASKQTCPIVKSIVSIGKSSSNDIVLSDDFVSNYHCKIENRKGKFFIKDLESTNGTILNGQKIVDTSLPFDSIIEIGTLKLRFFCTEEVEPLSPALDEEFQGIRSKNKNMRQIFTLIRKISSSDATVLIQGETGTGKELVARAVHRQSEQNQRPFVAVNCGAISKDLIESELFGHEKGAFTSAHQQRRGVFEQAHTGTLFLDEIGELPLDLQPKLLRVLETGEMRRVGGMQTIQVNVRIIVATNRNLANEVQKGQFREDLYYRLYVIPIQLPPLRERIEDIPLLAKFFLEHEFSSKEIGIEKQLDKTALDLLMDHSWPGNIRELKNVLGRAVLHCPTSMISQGDIEFSPLSSRELTAYEHSENSASNMVSFAKTLKDVEKEKIISELKRHGWNKKATAQSLGIAKSTLHEKIKKYEIEEDKS